MPKVVSGKIERIKNFKSDFVTSRNIDIWLPENYDRKKKSWNVDDVIRDLLNDKKIKNVIVVGIWNAGTKRHADYFL